MSVFTLHPEKAALLLVDVQEKLYPIVSCGEEAVHTLCRVVNGFQCLDLPMLISEQYPQGLGSTVETLRNFLKDAYHPWVKTTFSCIDHPPFFECMLALPHTQWIVGGFEAHICVLQTVKGLLNAGKQVAVLRDGVASRSLVDCSTALDEMHDAGARVTCSETVLFELLKDSSHPAFKSISRLVQSR